MRFHRWRRRNGAGISILVPFNAAPGSDRERIWEWLRRYWRHELPQAEIIVGRDCRTPFSKTAAVNEAATRASGDILVILDADAYMDGEVLTDAAREIRHARRTGRRLWLVPYRRFYRLSRRATIRILVSSPWRPRRQPLPPKPFDLDGAAGDKPNYGHHYAAMAMVLPREAFDELGGMDERFCGWGAEDISFMRALDTIYAPHKTLDRSVFHLYHKKLNTSWGRRWEGQRTHEFANLGSRYSAAYGDRRRMRSLVAEGI